MDKQRGTGGVSFKLGDRVRVKARLKPDKHSNRYLGIKEGPWCLVRRWLREEAQAEGIVAGIRTVQEGKSEPVPDYGYVFTPERWIKAYLVAVNMRQFWYVLPEDMELIGVEAVV